jgi:hypothetical protein
MLGLWYFTWVFFHLKIWPCDFDLQLVFDLRIENFYLGHIFWIVCTRTLIFYMSVSVTKRFHGYQQILPCNFDLNFWSIFIYKFTLGYILWIVCRSTRALILRRIFLMTEPFLGYKYIWPYDLDLDVERISILALPFVLYIIGLFNISHECSLTNRFDLETLTLMFDLLIGNFNLGYIFK